MKPLSSDRSDNNCCDIKSSISAIVVAAIAGELFPYDRWTIFSAITAIVVIIWKPGLIYRNNHPPFLLNCYLYALQTYRTHSSKLRLLLVKLKEYTTWLWFHCVTALAVEMTYPCSLVLACQPTPARLRFLALSASVQPSFPWLHGGTNGRITTFATSGGRTAY